MKSKQGLSDPNLEPQDDNNEGLYKAPPQPLLGIGGARDQRPQHEVNQKFTGGFITSFFPTCIWEPCWLNWGKIPNQQVVTHKIPEAAPSPLCYAKRDAPKNYWQIKEIDVIFFLDSRKTWR